MLSAALSALMLPLRAADAEATIRHVREGYAAYGDAERHLGKPRLIEAEAALRRDMPLRPAEAVDAYLALFRDRGLRRISGATPRIVRRVRLARGPTSHALIIGPNREPRGTEVGGIVVLRRVEAAPPDRGRPRIAALDGQTRFLLDLRDQALTRDQVDLLLPYLSDRKSLEEPGWDARSAGQTLRVAPMEGVRRVGILIGPETSGEAERLVALVAGSARVRTFGIRTSGAIDTSAPETRVTPSGLRIAIPTIRSRRMASLKGIGPGVRPDEEIEPGKDYDWAYIRAHQWVRGLD